MLNSLALSIIIRMLKIWSLVPTFFLKPICSSAICSSAVLAILESSMRSRTLLLWLIRAMMRCSAHSVVPTVFGIGINIVLSQSVGHSPLSNILLHNWQTILVICRLSVFNNSAGKSSIPAALFLGNFRMASSTSDSSIGRVGL